LGVIGLVAGVWLARAGVFPMLASRSVLTIPKGTAASLRAGQDVIPSTITLRAGDLFILRNEDAVPHRVGGFYVRPGESLSHRFTQVGTFDFVCTIHRDGHTTFVVDPGPSLAALWPTELTLLGILVLASVFLMGSRSTRLRISTLAAGSAITTLGLFLTIDAVVLDPKQEPITENRPPPDLKSLETGRRLYLRLCEVCHGASGRGDGPLAASLTPPPANLIEHVPQHPDRVLFWFIYYGIPGTRMPALRDTLTHEEIWHLVNYIKTLPASSRPSRAGNNK
jgi:mono/diheme cytochrome c family protein